MTYILAFLFCGIICAIGQIILDNTKLTTGHLNSILVIIGCILSGLGAYEWCISTFGAGATVPITNFGHMLVQGTYEGYKSGGLLGASTGLLDLSSAGLGITLIISFFVALVFKPRH